MSAAWFRRHPTKRAKFGVHSAMPLRTAAKLCPQAIFVNGHPERYRECSEKVYRVLTSFSPLVEMASIDEAYLDMTGTARLHGPPSVRCPCASSEDQSGHAAELFDRHWDLALDRQSFLGQGQAARNTVGHSRAGGEVSRAARRARYPWRGEGHGTKPACLGHPAGRRSCPLRRCFSREQHFGKWGLALAGKARGEDAGGWFDTEVGADTDPKSISHEHTYNEDTADPEQIESTLMRLSEMVGRRLRENGLHARTIQLKLRYKDFTTITRAHSLPASHAARHRDLRAGARVISQELAQGNASAFAGSARVVIPGEVEAGRSARGRSASTLAASAIGRGPPARQIWRVERVAGQRIERRLQGTHPRESSRTAGQGEKAGVVRFPPSQISFVSFVVEAFRPLGRNLKSFNHKGHKGTQWSGPRI